MYLPDQRHGPAGDRARPESMPLGELTWALRAFRESGWDGLTSSYARVWELAGRPDKDAHRYWLGELVRSRP
jgi:hypothetical protein